MSTPLGTLRLRSSPSGKALRTIELVDEHTPAALPAPIGPAEQRHSAILDDTAEQIARYVIATTTPFTVPVLLPDTASASERAVWEYSRTIAPGHAVGVARVAALLGITRSAVQKAVASNPAPIVIPTHRILGAGGRVIPPTERRIGSLTRRLHAHERISALP